MSDARSNYEREICSPYRRLTSDIEHTPPRRLVLLRRADGTDRNSPRDFKSYDGRGASTALVHALERASAAVDAANDRGACVIDLRHRALMFHEMALEQVEREQRGERR